ncbi:hypothetical protein BH18ACT15_BH18ACT15_01710 [soil metagenome]
MVLAVGAILARGSILELARDPLLTVACVLLIAVSLAWIVVAMAINRRLKRAGNTGRGTRGSR